MNTMKYSGCLLLACLVAANGYILQTPLKATIDGPQVSHSPLVIADPNHGKISVSRPLVSPASGSRSTSSLYLGTTLHRQKRILQLLVDLSEPSTIPDIAETAKLFSVVYNLDRFMDVEAVEDYWTLQQKGLIFRNKKFSIFNERHRNEAIGLFKVFYSAKDFEIFYKTAAWARQNVNEGCFIYALTLAVLHRGDTRDITLPALYEIYPWYFVHGDVLRKADIIKTDLSSTLDNGGDNSGVRISNGTAIFEASMMYNDNLEASLAYFTEDIGLNMFYYYQQMIHPYWLNTGNENNKFGEHWYYLHQQMLARYYLERLSNGMGEIPEFSWDTTIKTGYNPALIYPGGKIFPSRKNNYTINTPDNTEYLMFVKTYEQTLMQLIESGDFLNMNGGMNLALENIVASMFMPEILSSTFQGKNYDAVARYLLGAERDVLEQKEFGFSSVEHYETSLRDPIFWQLQKHIMNIIFTYKQLLPRYTETELNFPGVRVTNVEMTKLYTQYEYYNFDISNVFPKTYVQETIDGKYITKPLNMKVAQARLSHKPFMVKMAVNSERAVEAVVKIFIAPKVDGNGRLIDLDANKYNFIELDSFIYTLSPGDNIIVRKSEEFKNIAGDSMAIAEMSNKVENALLGLDIFRINKNETFTGFPSRLLIPKGTKTGFLLQMFVIVSPLMRQSSVYNYDNPTESNYYENGISLGYPFDRRIDTSEFYQPNMYMKDVVVTNKGDEKKKNGAGKPLIKPFGEDTEHDHTILMQGATKTYDYTSRKKFDYMAKKNARNDIDYTTKTIDSNINSESEAQNNVGENTMEENTGMFTITTMDLPNNMDASTSTTRVNIINDVYKNNEATGRLEFEDKTIKRLDDGFLNIEFDKTFKDRENTTGHANIDNMNGHGLLRSSGKYDYTKKRFDYAAKRDAKKKLEIENSMIVDAEKMGSSSVITNKMNFTKSNIDNIDNNMDIQKIVTDETVEKKMGDKNEYQLDSDEKVIPLIYSGIENNINKAKYPVLLKSSGKYEYSKEKFDYDSKKKERKALERDRKEAVKTIIKNARNKTSIYKDEVDSGLDVKNADMIDVAMENMVDGNVELTTQSSIYLIEDTYYNTDMTDDTIGSIQDNALVLELDETFDGTKDTLQENDDMETHQISNHGLLKSTGNTDMYYSSEKNMRKRQEKEMKKAMKRERKLAAAEEKKLQEMDDLQTADDPITTTKNMENQKNYDIIYRDEIYMHGIHGKDTNDRTIEVTDFFQGDRQIIDTDFEDYNSREEKNINGNSDKTYHDIKDEVQSIRNDTSKYTNRIYEYVFYDSMFPVYE